MRTGRTFWKFLLSTLLLGIALRFGPLVYHTWFLDSSATGTVRLADFVSSGAQRVAEGLGEALIIAAILGMFVDRYAKLRLATEVGEKIAARVHGYHLPAKLRQELANVNEFSFIARNVVWDIKMTPADEGDGALVWRWTLQYEIVNVTDTQQTFHQMVGATVRAEVELEKVKILEVAHFINEKKVYHYHEGDKKFRSGFEQTRTMKTWTNKPGVKIPPMHAELNACDVYKFTSATEKHISQSELREVFLRYPTIGFELIVDCPDGFEVWTSLDADKIVRSHPVGRDHVLQWYSDRVYLNNQRIWIKHEVAFHDRLDGHAKGAHGAQETERNDLTPDVKPLATRNGS